MGGGGGFEARRHQLARLPRRDHRAPVLHEVLRVVFEDVLVPVGVDRREQLGQPLVVGVVVGATRTRPSARPAVAAGAVVVAEAEVEARVELVDAHRLGGDGAAVVGRVVLELPRRDRRVELDDAADLDRLR